MITCVAVGDVMNCGSNAVVVISGDGWCHIYLCLNSTQDDNSAKLELVHNQRIPPNTKVSYLKFVILTIVIFSCDITGIGF